MDDGTYVMYAWRCAECIENSAWWSETIEPVTFATEAEARVAYQQHLIGPWHSAMVEATDSASG